MAATDVARPLDLVALVGATGAIQAAWARLVAESAALADVLDGTEYEPQGHALLAALLPVGRSVESIRDLTIPPSVVDEIMAGLLEAQQTADDGGLADG